MLVYLLGCSYLFTGLTIQSGFLLLLHFYAIKTYDNSRFLLYLTFELPLQMGFRIIVPVPDLLIQIIRINLMKNRLINQDELPRGFRLIYG